jgi:GGDEF domain-containing protein
MQRRAKRVAIGLLWSTPWQEPCDVNGLKALNDEYGYAAGDILIHRFAEGLLSVGRDVYHDKGDEFLCKGKSFARRSKRMILVFWLLTAHIRAVRPS